MKKYIYIHRNKITKEVFYVGMGSGFRAYSMRPRNAVWQKYINYNGNPSVEIVKDNLDYQEAIKIEMFYISLYKRISEGGSLTNKTKGGECPTELAIESQKRILTGKKRPEGFGLIISKANKGRKRSDEIKNKMSEAQKVRSKQQGYKTSHKKIIDIYTGEIFNSIQEVAKKSKYSAVYIGNMILGNNKNKTQFRHYNGEITASIY